MAEWVVFRLSALGDVTLMTGVLERAHRLYGHTFTVITREPLAPLFEAHPAVTGLVPLPRRLSLPATLRRFRELASCHAGQTLLDWHGTLRSRLLALVWQGPVRRYRKAGFARRLFLLSRKLLRHEAGGRPLLGRRFGGQPLRPLYALALAGRTVTQRYAATLEPPGAPLPPASELTPRLFLRPAEREAAAERLRALPDFGFFDGFGGLEETGGAFGLGTVAGSAVAGRTVAGRTVPAGGETTLFRRPLVALHPYATHASKTWPQGHWLALMKLLRQCGMPFFVIGQTLSQTGGQTPDLTPGQTGGQTPDLTPGQTPRPTPDQKSGHTPRHAPDETPGHTPRHAPDQTLGEHGLFSLSGEGVPDFTNQTGLRETCALLAEADVLVSGDSGPLHLASAVQTPVIALFGPTTRHWGFFPQGSRDRVLETPYACRPCSLHGQGHCPHHLRCLRDMAPELVLKAILGVLASPRS